MSLHQQAEVNKSTHGLQSVPSPAVAYSSVPEPNASQSHTTFPWQSSSAHATNTGRNATADPWAGRAPNSYNTASASTVPYANQNAYGDQSTHSAYSSYGSTAASSRTVPTGRGPDRNGYGRPAAVEYQAATARDSHHRRRSRSPPDPGAGRDYGGTQGYAQPPLTRWSAGSGSGSGSGQQSYNPEPSRQWSSARQGYPPAEPSRQWGSARQSYASSAAAAESSRQWSSDEPQGYNGVEAAPRRPWDSEASRRQWDLGKQDAHNPSDGRRRSYDQQQHWRR